MVQGVKEPLVGGGCKGRLAECGITIRISERMSPSSRNSRAVEFIEEGRVRVPEPD